MIQPRVSVVLTTLNDRPEWLRESVDSILQQEGVDVQLIVSTVEGDDSIELTQELSLEVFVNDHAGIYYQLNNALPLVTGDWFACAGGNDVLLPTEFFDEISLCQEKGASVCYSDFYTADAELENRKLSCCQDYSYETHITIGNMVTDNAMTRRDILEKYKPFRDGQFGNYSYYDFWLRVAAGEGETTFIHNPKPEWIYRFSSESSRHVGRRRDKKRHRAHLKALADLQEYHRAHHPYGGAG